MSAQPQFNTAEPLRLLYGFDLNAAPLLDVKTRGVKSTHVALQAARSALKNSDRRRLFLAWRQGRDRSFFVGEFRKDKLGRIRFVGGWPASNGLTLIKTKDVFTHG